MVYFFSLRIVQNKIWFYVYLNMVNSEPQSNKENKERDVK
ncbi:MAG: hypothetical protein RLZZ292_2844 [Bacteroidota bacterium]|jgi:hypothetical protein